MRLSNDHTVRVVAASRMRLVTTLGRRVARCLLGGVVAALSAATCRPSSVLKLPILGTDTVLVRDFTAATFCADTLSGRSRASLTWRTDTRLLEKQRVDVTVYKRGFETDTYAILWPLQRGQTFRDLEGRLPNRPDKSMVFLTLIDLKTSARDRVTSVELGGLHPGVSYFWRILTLDAESWTPGGFASAPGPICPEEILSRETVR